MTPSDDYLSVDRFEDFRERYREDRDDINKVHDEFRCTLRRIESKVDAKRWSPSLLVALFGPLAVAMIGAVAMIITKGSP